MNKKDLDYIINAHKNHPITPDKAFRKWDGKTPYYFHPIWCATMLVIESTLDNRTREDGVLTLLYHDVLEDTSMPLPDWLSNRVKMLICEMTFGGGSAQEMREIWKKSPVIRLYKLYDKVSNLFDGCWMDYKQRKNYSDYTRRLCVDVEQNYGTLHITRVAKLTL